MHRVTTNEQPPGFTVLEVAVVLLLLVALLPPVLGYAWRVRADMRIRQAQEEAAQLFSQARWTGVSTGSSVLVLTAKPPGGVVLSAGGDTVAEANFGNGAVSLRLSGDRATSRLRFGPLGLGLVSSQTLRFGSGGQERRLVVSSLGRVSRR